MANDLFHISEAEAASDFAALMARVRAGAEVIIENGARPVAGWGRAPAGRRQGGGYPPRSFDCEAGVHILPTPVFWGPPKNPDGRIFYSPPGCLGPRLSLALP